MPVFDSNDIEDVLAAKYEEIECPVLRENTIKFIREYASNPEALALLNGDFTETSMNAFKERFSNFSSKLDIYSLSTRKKFEQFYIFDEEALEFFPRAEMLANVYIGLYQTEFLRRKIEPLPHVLKEISEKARKAAIGIEESLDDFETCFSLFSLNTDEYQPYMEALRNLVAADKQLRSAPDFFKQLPLSKATKLGQQAPHGNPALQLWVESMYWMWLGVLGRSIENLNDGKNGRKHLLDFLVHLMEPIHEAIETETLDNMLRKVQKDVKARGGVLSPNFKLGSSSPLIVNWSNPES